MRRAFVPPPLLGAAEAGQALTLDKEASHHLTRVLRLPAGHEVELFDGTGRVAAGRLDPGPPARVVDLVIDERDDGLPPLVVVQALVRPSKLEEVVRRATELGASAVTLFEAERSQPGRFDEKKRERLDRVALDAVRQCERVTRPAVVGPTGFSDVLTQVRRFSGLVAVGVLGAETPLSGQIQTENGAQGLMVVIGPEGGLTDDEVESLVGAGAVPCRLGAHVLRTETAALVALAAAQASYGRL